VLSPGDRVEIPERREKSVECSTGRVHRFKRRSVPERLRLTLLDSNEPRAGVRYELHVDGMKRSGSTDTNGQIVEWIAPDAERAVLVLESGEAFDLALGHLDPGTMESGIRARLFNLGYLEQPDSGDVEYVDALRRLQEQLGLDVTGEADEPTCSALEKIHDS
jgi:N-acetylmuramoyl-L-alanine amidase